jgi:HPt (histidine-containing phosphotransfer) domain-containing protein
MRHEGQRCPPLDAPEVDEVMTFLDRDAILDRVLGNVHLLQELIKLFFEECPRCLGEIRQAIEQGNAPALRQAAHLLRGSVASFGTSPVYDVAGRLEAMGRTGNLAGAHETYLALDRALHQLQPFLAGMALEPTSP